MLFMICVCRLTLGRRSEGDIGCVQGDISILFAGSRPTKVVCSTVLTGDRMWVNCPLWPVATPSSEL